MNATKFAMGPLVVTDQAGAAELVERTASLADAALPTQGGPGAAGGGQHQDLIDKLTALRDLERSLATEQIAQKTKEYQQVFDTYMAAYVRSYTSHLSGSIGSSTQLTALIGTAGELSGDTALAKAVVGQANAVDALGMARRHTGAADAIDQVIRLVRQQGTDGLADELRQRTGEERTEGQKAYAAGQSQLSQAMIPYSMAYTDVFTRHLSDLTGGSSAGAMSHFSVALAATQEEFATSADLADDNEKVSAAMTALAAASGRSGAGEAYEQVALRFADELASGGAGTGDSGAAEVTRHGSGSDSIPSTGITGLAIDHSLAAQAETMRLKKQAAAQRKSSNASSEDTTTTVIDENAAQSGADEIAKFAGGIPGVSATDGKSDAANDTSNKGNGKDDATASTENKPATKRFVTHPSPVYGMIGMGEYGQLKPDLSAMMNDTADLSDAATLLADALRANATGTDSPAPNSGNTTRVFLLIPGM